MNATNSPDQDLKAGAPFFGVRLTWNGLAILAALALGSGLRLYFYLLNRSLWFDEALLALNLVDRSFAELLQPLAYNQGAPLGFLMVQKAIISTLGNRDYLLRLFPLLGGLASLPLFYLAARLFLQPFAVQAALWLMALSPPLIYYASENKQYSTDVFFAVLLLWLAGRYLQNPTNDRKLVWLAICGAVAIWFSHPSLFVLAGFLFAFCIESLIVRDRQRLVKLLAAGALGVASLALTYVLSLQHLAANANLKNYWQASFAPLPPWENWSWYAQVGFQILENPLKLPVTWLSLAVLAAGMLSLFMRQRSKGLLISLPILLTLAASALEKYPFGERLGLFMTPILLLILAEGMDMIRIKLREINLPLSIIAFLALLIYFAYPAWQENSRMLAPDALNEHIKPLLVHLRENMHPQDRIYVYYGSEPAFRYYAAQFGFAEKNYWIGAYNRDHPDQYLQEIERFAGSGRVWFLFSHNCSWCAVNEEAYILAHLEQLGQREEALAQTNASLYLYDLR